MNKDENINEKNALVSTEDLSKDLDVATQKVIKQTIVENDANKAKDLTMMFNNIQKKKAMIRVDKLNTLLDTITDQAIERFTTRPDEISNQELFQGLKAVQDISERNQKMILDQNVPTPLIQINQQEVNVGEAPELDRESRDKVKNAVANVLASISSQMNRINTEVTKKDEPEVVEATYTDIIEGEQDNE